VYSGVYSSSSSSRVYSRVYSSVQRSVQQQQQQQQQQLGADSVEWVRDCHHGSSKLVCSKHGSSKLVAVHLCRHSIAQYTSKRTPAQ
jgi:hypothetical protein